jgi:hypothetical protein
MNWQDYHVPDEELKRFGWAPGNYTASCITCKAVFDGSDKRSMRCRECATGLHGLTGGAK